MTLSLDIQHNSIQCNYADCRDYLNVMQSVVLLNVIMPITESSSTKHVGQLYLELFTFC
jgi:hypothetical protein